MREKSKRRGIYVLPNLLTTGALFFGFFSIIQATYDRFDVAAVAILISLVLDGLDGRVARLTKTTSDFGKEYDSLSDVICFGLAPALVVFDWTISDLGKIGWLCAFLFVASTALRLARFNTFTGGEPGYFQGLPCPPAAALLVTWMWVMHDAQMRDSQFTTIATAILVFCLALAMVSSIPYLSFKNIDLKGKVPFVAAIAMVLVIVLISFDPPRVLFAAALAYALSGPVLWVVKRKDRKLKKAELNAECDAGEELEYGGEDESGDEPQADSTEDSK